MKYSPSFNREVIMNFKFDGKKVKADMSKKLGYAQKVGTEFIQKAKQTDVKAGAQYAVDAAKAGGQTAKSMYNKSATGQKINAHGKGMLGNAKKVLSKGAKAAARVNPGVALGVFAGAAAMGTANRIKNRRKKNA